MRTAAARGHEAEHDQSLDHVYITHRPGSYMFFSYYLLYFQQCSTRSKCP